MPQVDLVFDGQGGVETHTSDEYKDGYVVLTNFRLIWMASQPSSLLPAGVSCHLPLCAVAHVELAGGLIKHARVKLLVRMDAYGYPAIMARDVERVAKLKLICKGSNPDSWRMQLETCISRAAWVNVPPGVWQELLQVPANQAGGQGADGSGSTAQRPAADAQPAFRPDPLLLHELCSMGFLTQQATNALLATNNEGTQQAVDWLLEHENSPLIDMQPPYEMGPLSSLPLGPSNPEQAAAAVQRQLTLGSVGVAGVLQREEQRAAATGQSLDEAFSDLSQLMAKAQEMVQLAEYFRQHAGAAAARRAASAGSSGSGGSFTAAGGGAGDASSLLYSGGAGAEGSGDEELDAETALDLVNLGIVSPVTRESAGALYYQELSRQLADFLQGPVEHAGSMMPLPDVYCLFNRARGTELVSPDDLLQAVRLFPRIRASLALREFASGVRVVQAASHSDERVCEQLRLLVQPGPRQGVDAGGTAAAITSSGGVDPGEAHWLATLGPAITQTEAAAALKVPVAVASEHLLMSEARGVLCRDDGPEGLRFFRNFFSDPGLASDVH